MTSPAEPAEPTPDGSHDDRITALEHGQVSIEGKLNKLLGMFTDRTPDAPAEPERPEVNIAEEIRRGLAELAASKPPEPAAATKPADLAEKPPRAPVRRLTRLMWGGDE